MKYQWKRICVLRVLKKENVRFGTLISVVFSEREIHVSMKTQMSGPCLGPFSQLKILLLDCLRLLVFPCRLGLVMSDKKMVLEFSHASS